MILVCLLLLLPLAGSFQPQGLMPAIQRHHDCRPPPLRQSRAAAARTSLFPNARSHPRMALTDGQTASVAEERNVQRSDGVRFPPQLSPQISPGQIRETQRGFRYD